MTSDDLLQDDERPPAGRVIAAYLYLWLMVGFFSGTLVLLGPAGWLSAGLQGAGWSESGEGWALKTLILTWFIATMFVTAFLVRRLFRARGRAERIGIPLVVTVLAAVSLAQWMNPAYMLSRMAGSTRSEVAMGGDTRFVFGAYPDRARLAQLKREGFVAVVSLQHPALPIEVPGIREERRAAQEMGMEFVHAPMLPWVSDNRQSLEVIRRLVREGRGSYYVHCGLGRDRTTVVRRLVESMGGRPVNAGDVHDALTFAMRKAQADSGEVPSEGFERGKLLELERDLWLIPHPNQSEMFNYMLAGQVRQVVSVLDPADPAQRKWLEEQRRAFAQYQVAVTFMPLAPGDTARARAIVELARRLPRPVALIAPRTTWTDYQHPSPGTQVATALQRAHAALPRTAAPLRTAGR